MCDAIRHKNFGINSIEMQGFVPMHPLISIILIFYISRVIKTALRDGGGFKSVADNIIENINPLKTLLHISTIRVSRNY